MAQVYSFAPAAGSTAALLTRYLGVNSNGAIKPISLLSDCDRERSHTLLYSIDSAWHQLQYSFQSGTPLLYSNPMLTFLAALLLPLVAAAADAKQPHLVLMVLDDLGWSDVGFHGSGTNFRTPQLDSLAADGVILDKFYVQQVCSPTRSALMTGRYPFKTGLQHTTTLVPGTSAAIPKDTSTIAEVLKGAGYATHAIGKWHLGLKSWGDTPLGRGFDSWAGYLNGAIVRVLPAYRSPHAPQSPRPASATLNLPISSMLCPHHHHASTPPSLQSLAHWPHHHAFTHSLRSLAHPLRSPTRSTCRTTTTTPSTSRL